MTAMLRHRSAIAAVALLALWAGFAFDLSRPADATDYRRTAVQVAQSAHDAASTAALIARQQLQGRVFGTFATSAYQDAAEAAAGAAKKITGHPPPDRDAARLRDRIAGLVQATVRDLGAAVRATDAAALRAAAAGLERSAQALRALLTELGAA
jgi:hypothetical protein